MTKPRKYIIEVGNTETYLWKKIDNSFQCLGCCGRYGDLKTPKVDFIRVPVGDVEEVIEKMGYDVEIVGSSIIQINEKKRIEK